ncbi:MAG: hypothetical protein M3R27_09075 [Bacteroidota bacterium]|nr:hypothetical protein [Bacteroidota bacterium]
MKPFISLVALLLCIHSLKAVPCNPNSISIEEASRKGLIKLVIKSKGGYTGEVIEMKIRNISSRALNLILEAGRRLDSKTDTIQDILVTHEEEFFVSSGMEKSLNVFGMCCQASNHAPDAKAIYTVGKMADSALIKLALFINKNNYYDNYTAQQAVWAISDKSSIGSIIHADKKVQDEFRSYVSALTGRPVPSYDVEYMEGSGSAMGQATKIEGVFDYDLPVNCHATLGIYNSAGELVQLLFRDMAHEKGDHKLFYTFRVWKLPAGTYYAKLDAEGMPLKQMEIQF